jgi:excinuclease ABC subunit A
LGGEVVFTGPTNQFLVAPESITAPYLRRTSRTDAIRPQRPVDIDKIVYQIELTRCSGHNLKNVHLRLPLNRLVTVTGVSGSGKSSLISQTLYPALARALGIDFFKGLPYGELRGHELIKNVLFIDQSSIGKTARSTPASYLKIFDSIRNLFASIPEAKALGYTPGTFSLNVDGGRCPVCKGLGAETINMLFMDDIEIQCEVCHGKKFRDEILEIRYKGKSINEVLALTVDEAMNFFVAYPNIRRPLAFLKEVGLGYLALGQSASSLSGGESQRLKIAREFLSTKQKSTLYILDEPTTGLHFQEVNLLLGVLNKLIEGGGSVVVIEHNLEVIRQSDFIIDVGPEGGYNGGQIVAQGSPIELAHSKKGFTGQYLKHFFEPSKKSRKPKLSNIVEQ